MRGAGVSLQTSHQPSSESCYQETMFSMSILQLVWVGRQRSPEAEMQVQATRRQLDMEYQPGLLGASHCCQQFPRALLKLKSNSHVV